MLRPTAAFFDEEPIVPVQSVMPVFTFIQVPHEIKIPVVVYKSATMAVMIDKVELISKCIQMLIVWILCVVLKILKLKIISLQIMILEAYRYKTRMQKRL